MEFSEYLDRTDTTAVYPDAGTGTLRALSYLALGLAGEASEVLEKELDGDVDGVASELGDVAWYFARFLRELDLDAAGAMRIAHTTLGMSRADEASRLIVAVGRVAELVKKAIRDDGAELTETRWADLASALVTVLRCWLAVNVQYLLDVTETLERNAAKLADRRDRGVLAGSGDHR